ncbi:MAG: hypothetical protein ACTSXE_02705 [Candidatus Thorarchaeota archaeon]
MAKYTRKESIADFKAMWKELAISGSMWKENMKVAQDKNLFRNCPFCEYCISSDRTTTQCRHCPGIFVAGDRNGLCMYDRSPYIKWTKARNINERRHYASLVYKIEIKEGVDEQL